MKTRTCGILFILSVLVLILAGCASSKKIALDPDSKEFYETARLVMTKQEKDIFNHLPDAGSRKEFMADFWAKRDPDPNTEENEFKEEFFRRIDYANARFNEGTYGWNTDRGRIYIYLGAPDKIEEIHTHDEPDIRGPILWWVYYRYEFAVKFVDKNYTGHYTLDPGSGVYGDLFEAIERAKIGYVAQDEEDSKKFIDFKLTYNEEKKEFVITIPMEDLIFKEEEGLLKADFTFEFFVYVKGGGAKKTFTETRSFSMPEDKVVRLKQAEFTFSYDLNPGKYYVDVIIIGRPDMTKARKIFEIKA